AHEARILRSGWGSVVEMRAARGGRHGRHTDSRVPIPRDESRTPGRETHDPGNTPLGVVHPGVPGRRHVVRGHRTGILGFPARQPRRGAPLRRDDSETGLAGTTMKVRRRVIAWNITPD